MRIEAWLRRLVYATLAVLLGSGLAWWALDDSWTALRFALIAVHGIGALLFLLLLGAVAVLHVRESWHRRRNRVSGIVVAVALGLLVITAAGLYYIGAELARDAASTLHLIVGVVLPLLLASHVVAGIRSRPNLDDEEW